MMWRDWINETHAKMGQETGRHDNLPAAYKHKPGNKPNDLCRQLDLLRAIVFRDVDCFYKYGIFALFGDTK
jgi:tRNA (cmo5U34)-methyltransferase